MATSIADMVLNSIITMPLAWPLSSNLVSQFKELEERRIIELTCNRPASLRHLNEAVISDHS